jgi:predicted dinucleotide-binding enzyme
MNVGDTELVIGHTWSGAEGLARMIPAARIVSALNTVPGEILLELFEVRRQEGRPRLAYGGDDAASKHTAAEVICDEGEGGPELTYRFERVGA